MASGAFFRRPAVMLALALCSVGAVVTLMARLATGPQVAQKKTQLTSTAGSEAYPSFSPDARRLAYSAREASKISAFHVFVRELPSGTPRQLTQGEGSDVGPVWSPDGGTLAFLRIEEGRTACIVIPADGGAERKVAAFGPAADAGQPMPAVSWTPDGKSLAVVQSGDKLPAIVLVAVNAGLDTAKVQPITTPPDGSQGDSTPAVSPTGSSLAFVRTTGTTGTTGTEGGADIWLCDLSGAGLRRLTFDDNSIRGIAWTRDGQDILYSANRLGGWHIWRVPAYGGSPKEYTLGGRQAYYPAVGRNRLAFTDSPTVSAIWRASLLGAPDSAADARPVIRSTGREVSPVYSPDGKRIADVSDQTGTDEVFVCNADGGARVQVTSLAGPSIGRLRWSPDGRLLVFDTSSDDVAEVYTVAPAAGGKPKRVLLKASNASFSNDSKRIYFQSGGQIWKATADGGNPQALAHQRGAAQPVESADGKYVYFRSRRTFWRVPVDGGEEEEAIVPDHDLTWSTTIQPTKKGVYYIEFERSARAMVVSFYDFATRKSTVVYRMRSMDMQSGATFSISPDGKYILYPRVDQSQTNLMLVENFR
jgi:Tol biopolymer transport system component